MISINLNYFPWFKLTFLVRTHLHLFFAMNLSLGYESDYLPDKDGSYTTTASSLGIQNIGNSMDSKHTAPAFQLWETAVFSSHLLPCLVPHSL